MEKINLGQISTSITLIVTMLSGIIFIATKVKAGLKVLFKEQLDAIDEKLESINKHIDKVDLGNCKNYLITFLSSVESGDHKQEIEYQRFYEEYEHYKSLGGNSYVEHKYEQLKSEGKL